MTQIVLPSDTNAMGTAFGGKIMQWIDIAAAVAARRHAAGVAVTASMDNMHFATPARLGDVVVLQAQVNRAWRSSMEVGVRAEVEHDGGAREHIASAYLTFVAVDRNGKPRAVPAVKPETEKEAHRFERAAERRTIRLSLRSP